MEHCCLSPAASHRTKREPRRRRGYDIHHSFIDDTIDSPWERHRDGSPNGRPIVPDHRISAPGPKSRAGGSSFSGL